MPLRPTALAAAFLCAALALPALAAAPPAARILEREKLGTMKVMHVGSPALAGALEKQGNVALFVLLPPSYARSPSRRYPVVYFLHGYSGSPSMVTGWEGALGAAFSARPGSEFILVGVDGVSPMGGSFFVKGPIDGDWESWVVRDAVGVIDRTYRTVARREARGLAGYSMGGFGALNLSLRHPDRFACTFATGPGVMQPGDMKSAFDIWDRTFHEAYGRAFAPNPSSKDSLCDIPTWDGSPADAAVIARWEQGFGQWAEKLDAYAQRKPALAAVHVEVGTDEAYPWILEGVRYLRKLSTERGLGWEVEEFKGGHELSRDRVEGSMAPFFQRCLRTR
ncbi:MAG: alpha/beta hydrolase-fold protein [Anaeromyxobacter sp.]